jgi:autotransporter-associated beta strand protein
LIASGSSQTYTATLSTGTLGTQTQTFSLNAGDDQTLSGASPPADISTGVTLTVLSHAAPSLTVSGGNNQRAMFGTTGINAGLSLSNGTSGQTGLASLDVNSLGTCVSGGTGGALVASGSTQSYMATLSTGTLGTQTQVFSLNVGDDQTLPGASPPADISTGVTLTVVSNRVVTASTTNFGLVHVGSPVSQPITLSTTGDDSNFTRVTVGNAGPDGNGISVSGGTSPVFNGSTVTDQRTIGGVFSSVGTINGTITLPTTGEGLAGEMPINVPVNYTAQVYSGQAEWNSTTGYWATPANWKDTVGGGSSEPPGLSGFATDTATFGPNAFSGIVVVALNSASPVLSNLIFSSSDTSYLIYQTGTKGLTLTSSDGISPAAVTVTSGTHTVNASILLKSNLVVSDSGNLTFSENISDGGLVKSLTLDGGGELILSGNNTYTGGTNVTAGTLIITTNTAIANGTSLTIGAGGTFIFDPLAVDSSVTNTDSVVAVPEPSTFVLLGAGVIGMLGWAWRGRK